METLRAISIWLRDFLLPYGEFGLMALAICDSSFISLPEVNDLLLMTFSIEHPEKMLIFAAFTTAGSVIGCVLLYSVGRTGGESLLRRRFSNERLLRIQGWYKRYGVLAIVIPSLLPPPTPFKVFVLSAGAFGVGLPKFIGAVVAGRGIRYFSEGFLAVRYGEPAIDFVQKNFGAIGIGLAVLILGGAIFYVYSRRAGQDGQ
jgi:membrane protein YqaA with SNARE-associated domain